MSSRKEKILVVDDDININKALQYRLQSRGFNVIAAFNGNDALRKIEENRPELVLLDLGIPGPNGLQVLKMVREKGIDTTIIMVTASRELENAVEAMRQGAYDFVTKPFNFSHLEVVIHNALERGQLKKQNEYLLGELSRNSVDVLVSQNPSFRKVLATAQKAAASKTTILVLGESGTGKEVLARAIHHWSPRRDKPFVAVNCVSLSKELLESELFGHEKGAFTGAYQQKKGKLEMADGGTVFLDEIGDIEPGLQSKLLRVLQEQAFERLGGLRTIKVDIRFIAATNRDLQKAVRSGAFREDLYYRLNVISLRLPPLRERREDIPVLINHFLAKYSQETKKPVKRVSDQAVRQLLSFKWRGNVRELENVIEGAVVLCQGETIYPDDLPNHFLENTDESESDGSFHDSIKRFKRQIISNALQRAHGSQAEAAKLLGLNRTYLSRLIKRLDVKTTRG